MPRSPSADNGRGYLTLPNSYYEESPRRATFATSTDFNDTIPDSPITPIKKAWNHLHERRKSRAEVEEETWFGGLVDTAEQERKKRELWGVAVVGVVVVGGWVAWCVFGGPPM